MNALDYPEILEALENGTIPSRTIGGIVAWISNETGLNIEDAYITFRNEIIALSEGYFIYEAQEESTEQKGNESSVMVANKSIGKGEQGFCICCKTTVLARKL